MCASEAFLLQAGCARNGSQRERRAKRSPVPSVPESAAMLHELNDPKAWMLNVVTFSFCVNSGKPCTFLFVFLFEYVIFQRNININV